MKNEIVKKTENETGLAVYSREQFLQEFSPAKCIVKFQGITSVEKAVKSNTMAICQLTKTYDNDAVVAYLAIWITDLNNFLNVSRKMTNEQILDTAQMLVLEYRSLTIADINLIFKRIKKGDFGNMYESLDGTKLLGWFDKYSIERADWYEQQAYLEHDKIKNRDVKSGINFLKDYENFKRTNKQSEE
jgi:hypothetical protein